MIEDCSICLENIDSRLMLSCGHTFHTECIFKWFCQKNTCPLCCRKINNELLERMKLCKLQEDFKKQLYSSRGLLLRLKQKEMLIEKQIQLIKLFE